MLLAQPPAPTPLVGNLQPYLDAAERYRRAAYAETTQRSNKALANTIYGYIALFHADFPLDERVVASVLSLMADDEYSFSHIRSARSLISQAHIRRKLPDPTRTYLVRDVLRGIGRLCGSAPKNPKWAFTVSEWNRIMRETTDVMEKAVLATGCSAALRRSELAALDYADHLIDEGGLTIFVRRSKCDPNARGEAVEVPRLPDRALCPVEALEAWILHRGRATGALFGSLSEGRTPCSRICTRTVNRITQRAAALVGLDPKNFGAHSLRATCATHMIDAGIPDARILAHMRHAWLESLARYYRPRHSRQHNFTS